MYKMTIDFTIVEHLGINLYSNTAAVLTELVANAWDADATVVKINLVGDGENAVLTILDDGIGMSVDDMTNKFLRVGYRRREEDSTTGSETIKKRPVMGRKGLGKLSVFSLASVVEVQSAPLGGQAHGLRMSWEDIYTETVTKGRAEYHPTSLPQQELTVDRGTLITLKSLDTKKLGKKMANIRQRLARRFSVIGDNFQVFYNDEEITVSDRDDLKKVQFLWTLGGVNVAALNAKSVVSLEGTHESFEPGWFVKGWIGTVSKPKELADTAGDTNLNGIVVLSRGRLIAENIFDKVNDGRLFTKYIIGQIEADFLDSNGTRDIATSDRQRIQEDDPRTIALLDFLRSTLTKIESSWSTLRGNLFIDSIVGELPSLQKWIGNLPSGYQKSAREMVAKLGTIDFEDDAAALDLLQSCILAFERMKLRGSVDEFVSGVTNANGLVQLFADRDSIEAAYYREILKSRVEAVRLLQKLVDSNAIESNLRDALGKHMWILDSSWERVSESVSVEKRLVEAGMFSTNDEEIDRLARTDIRYRTVAGKHIIVEMKRYSRKMKLQDLVDQGLKYFDILEQVLQKNGENNPEIDIVFVIGQALDEKPERIQTGLAHISKGSRILFYDQLISSALYRYDEYLKHDASLLELDSLLADIKNGMAGKKI